MAEFKETLTCGKPISETCVGKLVDLAVDLLPQVVMSCLYSAGGKAHLEIVTYDWIIRPLKPVNSFKQYRNSESWDVHFEEGKLCPQYGNWMKGEGHVLQEKSTCNRAIEI